MVNQKQICVKMDHEVFMKLEQEASLGLMTRNRLINEAVSLYCELADKKRQWSCFYDFRGNEFLEELTRFAQSRIRNVGKPRS